MKNRGPLNSNSPSAFTLDSLQLRGLFYGSSPRALHSPPLVVYCMFSIPLSWSVTRPGGRIENILQSSAYKMTQIKGAVKWQALLFKIILGCLFSVSMPLTCWFIWTETIRVEDGDDMRLKFNFVMNVLSLVHLIAWFGQFTDVRSWFFVNFKIGLLDNRPWQLWYHGYWELRAVLPCSCMLAWLGETETKGSHLVLTAKETTIWIMTKLYTVSNTVQLHSNNANVLCTGGHLGYSISNLFDAIVSTPLTLTWSHQTRDSKNVPSFLFEGPEVFPLIYVVQTTETSTSVNHSHLPRCWSVQVQHVSLTLGQFRPGLTVIRSILDWVIIL